MNRSFPSSPSARLLVTLGLSLAGLAGCGGTVIGTGGSGGAGGNTGGAGGNTGGTGGSTTATGGQSADCPATEPTSGDPCNLASMETCKYGDMCCPNVWGCFNGAWEQYDVDCGAPAPCPDTPPAMGAPCGDVCAQWSPCGYACDGANSTLASCFNGAWEVTSTPCADPIVCGDLTCAPDEICLESAGGAGITYSCQPNPCADQPLSCECAGSICGGDPYECYVQGPSQLSCTCPICP